MIDLQGISKTYQMGSTAVHALSEVSLKIDEGEFIAIMGPSGSGKSTLMHLMGLLDVPDSGSYLLFEKEVSGLSEDELAILRRSVVGFIFQQFHLLPRMTALENAALPLIYTREHVDLSEPKRLLSRMGIAERIGHRPNELSGGQQQRVAIARSLVNGPRIIFADEPTGNLDSASSEEIMASLRELNENGITVVVVTHEEEIGRQARRLIRMRDGKIVSDERIGKEPPPKKAPALRNPEAPSRGFGPSEIWSHFLQGFKTLAANKVRTALSMLGILIGVAAVVAMLALGQGAKQAIEQQLSSLGSNLLMLRSGAIRMGGVAMETGATTRLRIEDAAEVMENIPGISAVSPWVQGRAQATHDNNNWSTTVMGTSPAYAQMRAAEPETGRYFTEDENRSRSLVAVIGLTVARELFGEKDPMGELIKLNRINFRVIGLLPEKGAAGPRDQDDAVNIPISTAMYRLFGKDYVDAIDIEAADAADLDSLEEEVLAFMMTRHKVPPSQQQNAFEIRNMADIKEALTASSNTMSVLLSAIAAISLVVGGIGIMNIMLVSVTERTREIGLRKAIGARRFDILSQFLAEAVVVSAVGGAAGVALGALVTIIMTAVTGWTTSISASSVLLAFFFSGSIGVIFGFYPARRAAALNPIDALRYE